MSEQEKVFCGSGKVINCDNGLSFSSFSLGPKDIEQIIKWSKLKNGWCNIGIMKRKEIGKHGETHYGKINTYIKPTESAQQPKQPDASAGEVADSEVPF